MTSRKGCLTQYFLEFRVGEAAAKQAQSGGDTIEVPAAVCPDSPPPPPPPIS
jgi:hypothetical protein